MLPPRHLRKLTPWSEGANRRTWSASAITVSWLQLEPDPLAPAYSSQPPRSASAATSRDVIRSSWRSAAGRAFNDTYDPIPYSALIFRDPDNIQLELFHLSG